MCCHEFYVLSTIILAYNGNISLQNEWRISTGCDNAEDHYLLLGFSGAV